MTDNGSGVEEKNFAGLSKSFCLQFNCVVCIFHLNSAGFTWSLVMVQCATVFCMCTSVNSIDLCIPCMVQFFLAV